MVSDERRNKKPYALPVQYIPYYSLKDQYIRDFTKVLKENMVQLGLQVVGEWIFYFFFLFTLRLDLKVLIRYEKVDQKYWGSNKVTSHMIQETPFSLFIQLLIVSWKLILLNCEQISADAVC